MIEAYAMVVDSPEKFHLLSDDLKKRVLKAAVATVNVQAALTRKNAVAKQKELFNTRNDWTERQTQFTRCPADVTSLDAVQATVGATEKADYMERQEVGGYHTPFRGSRLAIPTDAAREGGRFAGQIKGENKLPALFLRKVKGPFKKSYASSRARAVARAAVASKRKLVIHEKEGIFEIKNFRKTGDNIRFEKILIRNLEFSQTKTPARPWLQPASEKPAQDCQAIFNAQMDKIDKV